MFSFYRILYKSITVAGIVISLLWLSGCASVQRWDREYLSDPMMIFNADALETNVNQLILDSREGSSGGHGVGGGCACSQ